MHYDGQRKPRYHYERMDSGDSGEKSLLKWILGIVSTLFVAAILGAWQQAISLAELRADVRNLQREVNELKARIDYRS